MWTAMISRATAVALVSALVTGCGGNSDDENAAAVAAKQRIRDEESASLRQAQRTADDADATQAEIARLRKEVALRKEVRENEAALSGQSAEPSTGSANDGGSPGGKLFSVADRASFRALEGSLGGRSGVAVSQVGTGKPVSKAGSFQSAIAWSTSKVPVAMAAIDKGSAQPGALTRAITASDNASAETLWSGLGGGEQAASAADAELRSTGDSQTTIQPQVLRSGFTAFGQTAWTLGDQVRFTAGMPCTPSGKQVLALMGQTISAQRWGLGSTSWSAKIKGGWGPGASPGQGGGYIDRQMGILSSGGKQMAVTIMTQPSGGSHEAGTANLSQIAKWVVDHVDTDGLSSGPDC